MHSLLSRPRRLCGDEDAHALVVDSVDGESRRDESGHWAKPIEFAHRMGLRSERKLISIAATAAAHGRPDRVLAAKPRQIRCGASRRARPREPLTKRRPKGLVPRTFRLLRRRVGAGDDLPARLRAASGWAAAAPLACSSDESSARKGR